MKRRAHWLAVVSFATLGSASLVGCQSMGGNSQGSWGSRDAGTIRAAEPDDPQSVPSLQLQPMESAAPGSRNLPADDPFAPISVEQLLPATTHTPAPRSYSTETAPAGYAAPPATMNSMPGTLAPPIPMATMYPAAVAPSHGMASVHNWDPGAAVHAGCTQCGKSSSPGCGSGTSLMENMVIFTGADYFSNSGMMNRARLLNAAFLLNVDPLEIPNLDPQRMGGITSINAGAPFTPDGQIGFQIGGTYVEAEEGAQGFFTAGFFHRCEPGECWGVNWGAVVDVAYDDFIDYTIGQVRVKAGIPLTSRDEIGGWIAAGTNTDLVNIPIPTVILGQDCAADPDGLGPQLPCTRDTVHARVRPECHGFGFWRHVFTCGADGTIYVGVRENLGGSLVLGGTSQIPITDCWAIMSGGRWSNDSEDRGSWDLYLGLGYFPGGNARSPGVCGNRFLPYQEAANNTFMPMSINPRLLIVEPDHAPL
jgi:hypothetical protein